MRSSVFFLHVGKLLFGLIVPDYAVNVTHVIVYWTLGVINDIAFDIILVD